jgi:hypothetical protein
MDKRKPRRTKKEQEDREREVRETHRTRTPNPPFTSTGKMSAPKFGSAGSGGAEFEPGPEKD